VYQNLVASQTRNLLQKAPGSRSIVNDVAADFYDKKFFHVFLKVLSRQS
jgi:hypothetical protein